MNIEVIDENNRWIAVSKPAGIQVERNPFGPSAESLVHDYLSVKYKNPFVGIVHRIDRPTSGLVLLAKKQQALKQLNRQFSQQNVQKQYLARIESPPAAKSGVLKHWLVKQLQEKRAVVHETEQEDSKYCELAYEQLDVFEDGQALVLIRPKTGRYHQIRAQLGAIGCPIIGDDKYGSSLAYKADCIMLHAWKIEIEEIGLSLETPLPAWTASEH